MNEHVCRKFPKHIGAIRALADRDATFRCVLADYEEMCTWLTVQQRREGPIDPEEIDNARDLIGNLEDEILAMLSKGNDK